MTAKLLYLDIETAPNVAYVWGHWEQNVIEYVREWYILCFAYQWEGEDEIHVVSQLNFPRAYKRNRADDKQVCQALHALLDEADIVVAHNGDRFDLPKANARFLYHRLGPVSPPKTIDTLKVARRYFKLNANNLDRISKHLKVGRKVKHEGFELWEGCMAGDRKSWATMIEYNVGDIVILRNIYMEMRPYIKNHPNMALYGDRPEICSRCEGPGTDLIKRGPVYTLVSRFQQWQCKGCGGYSKTRLPDAQTRPTRTPI